MKKLLILSVLGMPIMTMAALSGKVVIEQGIYATSISQNGEWVASQSGSPSIYNVKTGEIQKFDLGYIGLGNTIANNGLAVGDANDAGVLFFNNETIIPEILSQYKYCNLNAVTPDGSRLVGMVTNPNKDGVSYVPFYADLDENANIIGTSILPYPDRDFFGTIPQYVTAVWISEDGKTIAGQVIDSTGEYVYPIIFTLSDTFEWHCIFPSEELFNPTGIEIVENPYMNEPPYPYPENFMNPLRAEKYVADYKDWLAAGAIPSEKPYEEDYMTKEQFEEYQAAVARYNEWYDSIGEKKAAFNKMYTEILMTSPSFSQNEMALDPSGEHLVMRGTIYKDNNEIAPYIYEFTKKGLERRIDLIYENQAPCQMLSDGVIVTAIPQMSLSDSYILLPGKSEFVAVQDFIGTVYPEASAWMNENLPGGTGVVKFSDDMTVMAGAVVKDMFSETLQKEIVYKYNTYIITGLTGLEEAGVEEISKDLNMDSNYRVYNLQGVKVMETKDAAGLKSLPKGIYVINGKKVIIK